MSEKQERKGTSYAFATVGARTERGGVMTNGTGFKICGLAVAAVGCIVTYEDGSEAVITDGAGYAAVLDDQPAALVGSKLSKGDRIVSTVWAKHGIFVEDGKEIPGLFDADWTPPPREPSYRFAIYGATTPRGGVLKETSSNYRQDGMRSAAGAIGDFIEYADGTGARIVTGVGLPGRADYAFAVVGSLLDNGDVINDSPHRDPQTATLFVPVNERSEAITRQ
jgi:uncharacterized Zn-binding protein involved in type VI secretion